MSEQEKVTSDGQTSSTAKQPETTVESLTVLDRDPKTGQRTEKAIQVTKEEKDALAKQGYRFAQEMGFLKNKSKEEAAAIAETMTRENMQKFIAELQKQQPAEKAPTAEEVQNNPQVLVDYVNKIQAQNKEEILTTVRKEREEQEKQKVEDDRLLFAYDTEIKAVLPDFPLVPRDVLVAAIQTRQAELEDIRGIAEDLQTKIVANIDVTKLPEDKKKAYAEALKAEQPPPAGVEGSATETKQPIEKTVDAVYEAEAKKHGWKL